MRNWTVNILPKDKEDYKLKKERKLSQKRKRRIYSESQ